MSRELVLGIYVLILAAFVGFEVISKVPTTLHTPLMSQTNAIHGIVMLGGLIVVGYANDPLEYVIGTIAIAFGTINIVGGFMVTDRMLGMFSRKPKERKVPEVNVLPTPVLVPPEEGPEPSSPEVPHPAAEEVPAEDVPPTGEEPMQVQSSVKFYCHAYGPRPFCAPPY